MNPGQALSGDQITVANPLGGLGPVGRTAGTWRVVTGRWPAALRDASEIGRPLLLGTGVLVGTFRDAESATGPVTALAAWTPTGRLRFLVPLGPATGLEVTAPVESGGRFVVVRSARTAGHQARITMASVSLRGGSLRETRLPSQVHSVAAVVPGPSMPGFLVWTAASLHAPTLGGRYACLAFVRAADAGAPRSFGCVTSGASTAVAIGARALWAVVIPHDDGRMIDVREVSLKSGRIRWQRRLTGPLPETWSGAGDAVLLTQAGIGPLGDARMTALDLSTGRRLWSRDLPTVSALGAVADRTALLACPPLGAHCTVRSLRNGRVVGVWPVRVGVAHGQQPGDVEAAPLAVGPRMALLRVTRLPGTGPDPSVLLLARRTAARALVSQTVPIRGTTVEADTYAQGSGSALTVTTAGVDVIWGR